MAFVGRAQFRRFPEMGWVRPSLADRVINDVRSGLALEEIVRQRGIEEKKVATVIDRAYRYGFIEEDEVAYALGLLAKEPSL
ncbi:MAG: hypothetical protein KGZ68_01005 [Dechloromonas sp.]|nr:hypothetical protein [Dechloromonas sp.]